MSICCPPCYGSSPLNVCIHVIKIQQLSNKSFSRGTKPIREFLLPPTEPPVSIPHQIGGANRLATSHSHQQINDVLENIY